MARGKGVKQNKKTKQTTCASRPIVLETMDGGFFSEEDEGGAERNSDAAFFFWFSARAGDR
jgi:hypothetical protein